MDKNKELQRKQEDAAFAHGLWWVGGAVLMELLLIMIYQFYYNFGATEASITRAVITEKVLWGALWVCPVLFIAAAVLGFLQFKKTGTICYKIEGALGLSGALSAISFMTLAFHAEGCSVMMMFIPAAGILAFFFFLYPHDFFYSAGICGFGALMLWMTWHKTASNSILIVAGTVKIVVVAALLCWGASLLKKSDGKLKLMGHSVRFLPHDAIYPVIFGSAALTALLTVAGFVVGGYAAYYMIYVLAAWIFAMAVYYTVRML